jgi:hypothetical protein
MESTFQQRVAEPTSGNWLRAFTPEADAVPGRIQALGHPARQVGTVR